jgi:hypothetical protein
MDWQLQFERAEMLRQFQRDLLLGMSHQLRSPVGKQHTLLTWVLEGWCESAAEQHTYLLQMQETLRDWMQHWQVFEDLVSYPLPIGPLHCQSVLLGSLWIPLQTLVLPLARDRGLRFDCPDPQSLPPLTITGDPQGCLEVALGLSCWSLAQVCSGQIRIRVSHDPIAITWEMEGSRFSPQATDPFWTVPQRLVTAMGGDLTTHAGKDRLQIIWIPLA